MSPIISRVSSSFGFGAIKKIIVPSGGGGSVYSIVSGNKAPVYGSGGGSYPPTGSWTGLQNGSVDDAFVTVSLPFNWAINSGLWAVAYVGSNTYITFGAGSSLYASLSSSNPGLNKLMLGAADNSYQRVSSISNTAGGQSYVRIRYEGNNTTVGTVGSPGIVYECTFFNPSSFGNKNVVEVLVGNHNQTSGQFGVANTATYYASGTIAANKSYVFEGDSSGTSWTIWTDYRVSGTDY